jgi:hypothetical protein
VRNVTFNAWHYADTNLWASLVTHIFDQLARPEPSAGVTDTRTARAQLARLEEKLATRSALAERLQRASEHARTVEARRRLLGLTWGLTGVTDDRSLGDVKGDLLSLRGTFRLLVPNARVRLWLVLASVLIALIFAGAAALLGASGLVTGVVAVAGAVATPLAVIRLVGHHVSALIGKAGEAARALEVRSTSIDAELAAARAAELDLQQEVADLSSGRRIAGLATERNDAAEYRAHLGLVARIHDDFVRMSEILRVESLGSELQPQDASLPRIDRIALYVDDLDRCPPHRVIEVLEAVHLILGVELFVVVVAVDPRWLLESLRQHYSELLAESVAGDKATDEEKKAWSSNPWHYLEKIIQVPFALRPMSENSVRTLVQGLLPVDEPDSPPVNYDEAEQSQAVRGGEPISAPSGQPAAVRPEESVPVTRLRLPSLNPPILALTAKERDYAVIVGAGLRTPRTVKKFTNLYRLLRAGIDDYSGQLDRFLADDTRDAPQYKAVLILLATIIAFPEEASAFLLSLGDLSPGANSETGAWMQHIRRDTPTPWTPELRQFLESVTHASDDGSSWTREPFRRWALEVSRYSFATGQEIFARVRATHVAGNAE